MTIVSPDAIRDPRLQWFRDARFGMFVHFGIYALLGSGEWVQYHHRIPRRPYEQLAGRFNPDRFDADDWVTLAEQAGCRYITFTVKHHDGFCMYDSDLTEFKITNTPFRRDLTAELVAACQRRGMRIVLYYSPPDWHHPNFVHLPGAFKDLDPVPADQRPDWPAYLAYFHGQVRELCTRYGRIDGLWFDGSHKSEEMWQGQQVFDLVKRYQPHAVVNDRVRCGDFFTPERSLPEDLSGYMFEACQSVSQSHWGYAERAPQYSVPNLVENLVRVVARGGSFLLNVGPRPDGTVPGCQAERMRAVGRWLAANGEAIFGTEPWPIATGSPDVLATRRGNVVYVLLCRWPETDRLLVPGIAAQPSTARLLANGSGLDTSHTDAGLEIRGLPPLPPTPMVAVVCLEFAQAPDPAPREPPVDPHPVVRIASQGATVLSVADARASGLGVKGQRLHIIARRPPGPGAAIVDWQALEQQVGWSIEVDREGTYRVQVQLACPAPYHGSNFVVEGPVYGLTGTVAPTASFEDYDWQELGAISIPEGRSTLALRPTRMPYGYIFCHVAALRLSPALD
jgi:alpha-L-fucosidase